MSTFNLERRILETAYVVMTFNDFNDQQNEERAILDLVAGTAEWFAPKEASFK